jgi:hypothetical protein
MYYIFYKTDDSGSDPTGVHFYQDISSYSLQQGDDIYIEWSLGVPNLNDNQLPLTDSNSNPMTWSGATYPNTKIKVFVYGDDDGTGTAHGTLITHGDMVNYASAQDFFDEQYTFNRTLGSGNGTVTTTDPTKFNTIRFVVVSIVDGETFYVDDVDFGFVSTTTDDWTLNSNVINNTGTLVFTDGGEAVQTHGVDVIEAGKTYRITQVPVNPVQNPHLFINGEELTSSSQDITFTSSSNLITLLVTGGGLSLPSITIQEIEPYGGDVECWNLNGADSDFLYTSQSSGGGSVIFDEAPEDTYLHQDLINTNQVLDFTDGTKCNVSFNVTNYTGSGELTFMLYNDGGEGFEYTINGNGSHSFSGTIGNDSSSTLTSKFGFYVSSANTFSGEIDNVSLVLGGEGAGKTISFNEKSKGWTSFKSFVPEFALSCVNQYYTMSFGQLWKHHVEQFNSSGKEINRNTFYGAHEESSVTPILNMQPAVVKNFNTLNYEGSQSKVDQFIINAGTDEDGNPVSDGQYYNLQSEDGWYVYDIHTDKQEGTLNEFIEKEGKWFNYIKGTPGQVDTAAFNFQGLGIIQDIELAPVFGCTIPTATNFDPLANTNDGSCGFAPGAFEMQIRDLTSPVNADGAARVVYTGTNIEAVGLTYEFLNPLTGLMETTDSYAWSTGGTTSEITGLGMGPVGLTLTDGQGNTHIVMHPIIPGNFVAANTVLGCTNPNATNFNYSANTDDGTCTI